MAPTCSVLMKSFIAVFIFSFMFLSASSLYAGAPNAPAPSYAAPEHPTLCKFDELYLVGTKYLDEMDKCNVGVLRTCGINQIYQFGDSVSDVGNLICEVPSSPFARLPYGSNFPAGPTGRASNGKLMIDYFAMDAGLPLLPAFKKSNADFSHGINFAVGGAMALPWNGPAAMSISTPMTNSSMSVQLDWMSSYFNSICHNQRDCGGKFENALFILGPFGGRDYDNALIFDGKSVHEVETELLPKVVDAIMAGVRKLISLGAKKVLVPGIATLHELPMYRAAFSSRKCAKVEDMIITHNELLEYAIETLNKEETRDAVVFFVNYHRSYLIMKSYALLEEAMDRYDTRACCGTGGGNYNFDLKRMCGAEGVTVCDQPQRKMHWDGQHLTQEAYRIMTKDVLYRIFDNLRCPS